MRASVNVVFFTVSIARIHIQVFAFVVELTLTLERLLLQDVSNVCLRLCHRLTLQIKVLMCCDLTLTLQLL